MMLRMLMIIAAFLAAPLAAQAFEKSDFFKPGIAPQRVSQNYDVTVVYFFDYQCPQCRRFTPDVERVMKEDRKIRWIYRDIPSISPISRTAARAAMAATFQRKHQAMHAALMTQPGKMTEAGIRAAAKRAGVDWARLQRDLKANKAKIEAQIDLNSALADDAGIVGTPAFIVGDTLADGALDYANLKLEIADARNAKR
jgi:protein-disulfide isomerase